VNRRTFVSSLVLTLLAAPLAAGAQQPAQVPRIGLLSSFFPSDTARWHEAFRQGLRDLGWVEGKNISIEYRIAEGRIDRLPDLAADLVRVKVDIIVAATTPESLAAKPATRAIPIVMASVGDPVAAGLAESLARPGGNITGLGDLDTELSAKRLELLKETVPHLARVAVLWNSADGGMTLRSRAIQGAARTLGVTARPLAVQEPEDFDQAFAAMIQERPDALLVVTDLLTMSHRKRIIEFTAQHRVPAMYEVRGFVDAGGLISYGPNFDDSERRAAAYVDRILRGARPGELPVEQPTRFELVVNLKTANALGLAVPQSLLIRADQVLR
jgi:ABC-type uncharacterized transport system substrate-binding protein